jgi:hypothetical protein
MLPVVVAAYVAVRIVVGISLGAEERRKTGKGWFESVPLWTKGLWLLIGIAVVLLYFWAPRNARPQAPEPATPAPDAAQPARPDLGAKSPASRAPP